MDRTSLQQLLDDKFSLHFAGQEPSNRGHAITYPDRSKVEFFDVEAFIIDGNGVAQPEKFQIGRAVAADDWFIMGHDLQVLPTVPPGQKISGSLGIPARGPT